MIIGEMDLFKSRFNGLITAVFIYGNTSMNIYYRSSCVEADLALIFDLRRNTASKTRRKAGSPLDASSASYDNSGEATVACWEYDKRATKLNRGF